MFHILEITSKSSRANIYARERISLSLSTCCLLLAVMGPTVLFDYALFYLEQMFHVVFCIAYSVVNYSIYIFNG